MNVGGTSAAHTRWLQDEAKRLLDFGRAAASPVGGFVHLDDRGRPVQARDFELFMTCRAVHCYALAELLGWFGYRDLVQHGLDALSGMFRDDDSGGWFTSSGAQGPADTTKNAYDHAFVILAASTASTAGHPSASALLTEALAVVERHFWDDAAGMVRESWDRSFTRCEDYRGVNSNMHMVEAFIAATDATGDRVWFDRAVRIAERVVRFAAEREWRIPEHFTADWEPILDYNRDRPADPFRPYGATVGHWMEWARLLLHLEAGLLIRDGTAPPWLREAATLLFGAAVEQGWHVDGSPGFVYTVDWDGAPVVRERMHWVLCEAIAAAAALHRATREEKYLQRYREWWEYAEARFIDRAGGSWWHELAPDHSVSRTVWGYKSDVYHALQATLVPQLPLAPSMAAALEPILLGD